MIGIDEDCIEIRGASPLLVGRDRPRALGHILADNVHHCIYD